MVQGIALQPVIKLTEDCNLRCNYCYQQDRRCRQSMPPAVLERLLHQLDAVARKPLCILWYGGEPTMVGLSRFRLAVELSLAVLGSGGVRHSLQTNGSLLDRGWADYLASQNFSVTVSIDGPPELQAAQRPFPSGANSHRSVVSGLRALIEAGIRPRVSCVVTERTLEDPAGLLDYFWDLGIRELDFPPALRLVEGRLQSWVTPAQYGDFLATIFQIWLDRGLTELRIRSLVGIVRRLAGKPGTYCKLQGDCSSYLTFAADGKVFACDEFSGLSGQCLGDLTSQPLAAILASAARQRLLAEWSRPVPECQTCRWVTACPGNCPFERRAAGGLDRVSLLCPSWKRLFPVVHEALGATPTS